jgi:hypothetical protein
MVSVLVELKKWPPRWRAVGDKALIARAERLHGTALDRVSENLTPAHGAPSTANYLYLRNIFHCSPMDKGFFGDAGAKTVSNLYVSRQGQCLSSRNTLNRLMFPSEAQDLPGR